MYLSIFKQWILALLVLDMLAYGGRLLECQTAVAGQPTLKEKASQEKWEGQKKGQPSTDHDKLRGRWKVICAEQDGKPVNNDTIYTFVQKGQVRAESSKGKFYPMVCRYNLDSSTNPKTLDIDIGAVSKGVYVLDGDTLVHRITFERSDEQGKAVRQTLLLVLKRESAQQPKPTKNDAGGKVGGPKSKPPLSAGKLPQEISIMTPDLWGLRCFSDGSGHLAWADSPGGLHQICFKAGTLDFRAMVGRIKELSTKEGKEFSRDGKLIASNPNVKAGACHAIIFGYRDDHYETWAFPQDGKRTSQFLYEVFSAAINEKATILRGKEFDKIWREKPPVFMPR